MSMLQLGARLDEGGWLPVSLTEFGHLHGFNTKADGGTVMHQPTERERK